ncbi:unnamed protein product [Urochloa humidicola]
MGHDTSSSSPPRTAEPAPPRTKIRRWSSPRGTGAGPRCSNSPPPTTSPLDPCSRPCRLRLRPRSRPRRLRLHRLPLELGGPHQVVEVSTFKTGKHGHAKCHFVGIDIFNGKKLEDIVPSSHYCDVHPSRW